MQASAVSILRRRSLADSIIMGGGAWPFLDPRQGKLDSMGGGAWPFLVGGVI